MLKFRNCLPVMPTAFYFVAFAIASLISLLHVGKGAGKSETFMMVAVPLSLALLLTLTACTAFLHRHPTFTVGIGLVGLLVSVSLQLYPVILDALYPVSSAIVRHECYPTPALVAILSLLTTGAFAFCVVNAVRMRRAN